MEINCSTGRIRDQHRLHAKVINAHIPLNIGECSIFEKFYEISCVVFFCDLKSYTTTAITTKDSFDFPPTSVMVSTANTHQL